MSLRASLWKDDLSQVQLKPAIAVSSQSRLSCALEMMRDAHAGYILVVDDGRLVGIFTERDLVKRVLPRAASFEESIGSYMTPNPVTIRGSDSVGWAIRTMYRGHYRHLPVVDEQGRPVGILSVKHIIHYLVEHVPSAVYNLPPMPGQVNQTREGA